MFQNSVLKEYLKSVDTMAVEKAFSVYKNSFLSKVENIKSSKEEQYQYGFFYELDFKTFLKELKKKKVTLSLKEQDEWEEYFESYQKELLEIKAEIDATDREIDEMVYGLYGLSEEEIKIIEGIK